MVTAFFVFWKDMPGLHFKKGERLNSRKIISQLFQEGDTINCFPLRIIFLEKNQILFPSAVAVIVPKKNIKKAVDRNLIKRRIKESYRLHKSEFYSLLEKSGKKVNLIILYQSMNITDLSLIHI